MRTARRQRIQELLREEISRILITEARDPRLGFITVTGVEVSTDLQYAWIYVSVFGDSVQQSQSMEGLNSAKSFIRGLLGRNLELRAIPELRFKYDPTVAQAARVDQILNRIAQREKGPGTLDSPVHEPPA